jgi:hypothetical protein
VLKGGTRSYTNHNCEFLKPFTLTFQFIQAKVLCKKIPVLQDGCVPVFGVPRLLIGFYRGRKWHRWKSLGGSSFCKQLFLLVCKMNQKL